LYNLGLIADKSFFTPGKFGRSISCPVDADFLLNEVKLVFGLDVLLEGEKAEVVGLIFIIIKKK
jgi:hypothetical protein